MTHFGITKTGEDVSKHTLRSDELDVSIITWGAAVQDLRLAGVKRSLTLGSDDLSDYEGDMCHHGTLIGPIANRISTGRVTIDGMTYELERNQDRRIHLHSGAQATHRRNWAVQAASDTALTLTCTLGDGECGLPGNRLITARFSVQDACLMLEVTGTTDAPTLMNFANHSYWNLDGSARYDGHSLHIQADRYLPCTSDDTPTGEIVDVDGTDMDFRAMRHLAVHDPDFDNNFCLSDAPQPIRDVLTLQGASGVSMTIATDQTGLQIYDARDAMRPGRERYEGLAIEAQGWPDAPSHPGFPSIRITPDQPYSQTTQWRFAK